MARQVLVSNIILILGFVKLSKMRWLVVHIFMFGIEYLNVLDHGS